MPPDPPRSLRPWRSFRKTVSIYPRSAPVLNFKFCGETGTFSFLEKNYNVYFNQERKMEQRGILPVFARICKFQ